MCTIHGCTSAVAAKGLCWRHYNSSRKYGDPFKARSRAANGEGKAWIEEHAGHKGSDCLIWPFSSPGKRPVGRIKVGDRYESSYRYMCILAHGSPPIGKGLAAHSCGQGHAGCVNPNHLRWADPQGNMDDKEKHGTLPRGEGCYNAKLSRADIQFIRENAGRVANRSLAEMFSIHEVTVGQIIHRKRWKHVE